MKKILILLLVLTFSVFFNSCIISSTPSEEQLTLQIGEKQLFDVDVFFPDESIKWFLDGAEVSSSGNTYEYEATAPGGTQHILMVKASYFTFKNKHTWYINVEDPGVSELIGSDGGTVVVTDPKNSIFGTKIEIPAGALSEDTVITISSSYTPGGLIHQPVSYCINFEPDGISFSAPVDLIFPYNDEDNDGYVDGHGIEEQAIAVKYFNDVSEQWEDMVVKDRDTINNTVRVATTHFSKYIANVATWQNLYGGSDQEEIHTCQQTLDGGYIIAGSSRSTDIPGVVNNGEMDFYIVKLDPAGIIEWQKMIGADEDDEAFSIQQTLDGGYILSGVQESNININGYYVVKLDNSGEVVWEKGYTDNGDDCANMVKPTNDGGYIIAGTAYSSIPGTTYHGGDGDYYIIKTDADGKKEWHGMYGGNGTEEMRAIQPASDGGYIVTGYSTSSDIPGISDQNDYHVFKLDGAGNVLWQKKYGGNSYDNAWFIQETSEGGYIVVGDSQSTDISGNHGKSDVFVVKLDIDGNVTWQKMYGGSSEESASSIEETSDGGYIIAGISRSTDIPGAVNHGNGDTYVIKINSIGDIIWQRLYGGSGREESDNCTDSAHQTSDGGYMIIVDSTSTDIPGAPNHGGRDFYVLKLDANGNL